MDETIFIDDVAWEKEWYCRQKEITQYCKRCLYNNTIPGIQFDIDGICDFCKTHDNLVAQYDGDPGKIKFENIIKKIKQAGKKSQYDVIVGVSGGTDSSYLLHLAKDLGLRPLAVHFDNTWNSTIAVENIQNILQHLNIELWTYIVDNQEYDDLYRAFLKSGTPDLEAPTDLGLAAALNIAVTKFKVKYIFEGHSYKTEGISPLGWLYMDAKYIQTIHKKFGSLTKLNTYPYMWFSKQLKWMLWNRINKIRPFWYLPYDKESAKQLLVEKYNWQWYGGHHLENRITNFYHTYFIPRRFNLDGRVNGYAAQVRSGLIERDKGIRLLSEPPYCDPEIVELVKKRLGITDAMFLQLMCQEKHFYREFKTYKPLFERYRPFFYIMAKANLIPMSFYLKYTKKEI